MTDDSQLIQHGTGGLAGPDTPAAPATRSAEVDLLSLAPLYEETHHAAYLARLNKAIADPRNRNIALTGRYGAGKSSVLDEFQNTQKAVLRLAISTLGIGAETSASPDKQAKGAAESTSLTNQIQKELVKQLVFSAKPSTLRHSRFRRRDTLPWRPALGEAAVVVGVLAGLAWFFGWLPALVDLAPGHPAWVRVVIWTVISALAVLVLAAARRVAHDRLVDFGFSAGGATLTLSERTPTFFDEYLDDIVHYFDSEDVDSVILEDLDRFNDPHIFEALRELNTLLNKTSKRLKKDRPLRFVYAVRDSLFEKLGADTVTEGDDAAAAEAVRANRTKFFDVVIPMVPFISHRNAKDLLQALLDESGIQGIDRSLVNLVARHATDMRLLRNMRNEYLVFAEQLLESDTPAPGLTRSNLFALVAYKNFHLGDFEKIARRASELDVLYNYRRDLVSTNIQQQQSRKRTLITEGVRERSRAELAGVLAKRLQAVTEQVRLAVGSPYPVVTYRIGGTPFTPSETTSYAFWAALAEAEVLELWSGHNPGNLYQQLPTWTRLQLEAVVPEAFQARRWADLDAEAFRSDLENVEDAVSFLRSADFAALTKSRYALTVASAASAEAGKVEPERSFAELVDLTMESDLARELVEHGYLDRNFALYAAKFYGTFTGVNVANFLVQNAETNRMEVDFELSGDGAVANLLDEADEDFTSTVSAYNIDIVNYLLRENHAGAEHVAERLATLHDDDAKTFLASYLTTAGAERNKLVARLAAHGWPPLFQYLVTSTEVPDDQRPALVNAALTGADKARLSTYELPTDLQQFIAVHYQQMDALTDPQPAEVTRTVASLLFERGHVVLPELAPLDDALRLLAVKSRSYQLTADNLRAALGFAGAVALDQVTANPSAYAYCLDQPGSYLSAVNADLDTEYTVVSPETLVQVLADIDAEWDDTQRGDHLGDLLAAASPGAKIPVLRVAPDSAWTDLARTNLFRASLANVEEYRTRPTHVDTIDGHLARLLTDAGTIHTDGAGDTTDASGAEYDRETAAVAVLNAATTIPSAAMRVHLAQTLVVSPVAAAKITPEAGELLALLLDNGLVADDAESFTRFHSEGWAAIGPAIRVSRDIGEFLAPPLVSGMVADLLADDVASAKVGRQVVENAIDFVPTDDPAALRAVGQYADEHAVALITGTVARVAAAQPGAADVAVRLLASAAPAATSEEIVSVFVAIGGEYAKIATSGAEFDVPRDPLREGLLTTLRNAGRITEFPKRRNQEFYTVKVA